MRHNDIEVFTSTKKQEEKRRRHRQDDREIPTISEGKAADNLLRFITTRETDEGRGKNRTQ